MQILAYVLSESLEIDFVLETVNLLISNYGQTLDCETLIHSDYTEENTMPKKCRASRAKYA